MTSVSITTLNTSGSTKIDDLDVPKFDESKKLIEWAKLKWREHRLPAFKINDKSEKTTIGTSVDLTLTGIAINGTKYEMNISGKFRK